MSTPTSTALAKLTNSASSATGAFYLTKLENALKYLSYKRAADKNDEVFVHPHEAIRRGSVRQWIKKIVFPYYFKYYRAPTERSSHAHYVMYARHKGFLVDDNRIHSNELYSRAYMITPKRMKEERERRIALGGWLHHTKMELDPVDQNFDPFIPYMAPYIEEMRYMMQEEEELLVYHQYHRKLYRNGFSGFGENQRFSKFLSYFG